MRVCEDCADDCFVDDKGKERLYLICLNQFCKLLVLRPVCSTILYLSSTVLGGFVDCCLYRFIERSLFAICDGFSKKLHVLALYIVCTMVTSPSITSIMCFLVGGAFLSIR